MICCLLIYISLFLFWCCLCFLINMCLHPAQETPAVQLLSRMTAVPLWCFWKVREKKCFKKLKHLGKLSLLCFICQGIYMFSGVWVEFGFVGDFVFTNGSLLWGCHFRSSLALNQQHRWKWPRTSKDFAFYNPSGGIKDRCHHTWLSLIIYVFFL